MAGDERALILKCKNGQEDAYQELLGRYEGYIYSLCFSFAGNREDARDLAQEALIRVCRGLHSFQPHRPFKPWLRSVTVNTCINCLEKRTLPSISIEQPLGDGFTLGDTLTSAHNPDLVFEWKEIGIMMKKAVSQLSPLYRLLITLRHQEGMSYQEIAHETGLPLGTVKTHLFRARAALRRQLSDYCAWGD